MHAPRFRPARELLGVVRGAAAMPRLLTSWSRLPRGDGGSVLVLPGFLAGDTSTLGLRLFLGRLGYAPSGWGLGLNRGDIAAVLPDVRRRLEDLSEKARGPIRLLGWSLGGVVAREVARREPERVSTVVTLGSPLVGGPKYTATARRYAARGVDLDAIEARVAERNAVPLPIPTTSIYSRLDSVVHWRACFDPNPENRVEHVEVRATHLAMGWSPEVFERVAEALARPPGEEAR